MDRSLNNYHYIAFLLIWLGCREYKQPEKGSFSIDKKAIHIIIENSGWDDLQESFAKACKKRYVKNKRQNWIDAKLRWQEKEYPIELRLLSGVSLESNSSKWPLEIKLKNDLVWKGMNAFNLFNPIKEETLNEWLLHEYAIASGAMATRMGYVPVVLNGNNMGIYAWEQQLGKQFVEGCQRREGMILKYEDQLYYDMIKAASKNDNRKQLLFSNTADITCLDKKKTKNDNPLLFLHGKALVADVQYNDSLAFPFYGKEFIKHLALLELFGNYKNLHWYNQRLYFNPILKKLEPIIAAMPMKVTKELPSLLGSCNVPAKNELYKYLNDSRMRKEFVKQLKKLALALPVFIERTDTQVVSYTHLLNAGLQEDAFRKESFLQRAEHLLEKIDHLQTCETWFVDEQVASVHCDGKAVLSKQWVKVAPLASNEYQISNYHCDEVAYIGAGGEQLKDTLKQNIIIPAGETRQIKHDENPSRFHFSSGGKRFDVKVKQVQPIQEVKWMNPFMEPYKDSFVLEGNRLSLIQKKILIDAPLYIPPGYQLEISAGSKVDLVRGGFIYSESPIIAIGSQKDSIIIESSDNTGKGLLVVTNDTSLFEYVQFKGLTTLNDFGWQWTGSVNFYETKVKMNHCVFTSNQSEDALNLVRSEVYINDCRFEEIYQDALDCDFCKGEISRVTFKKMGNDGLDVSGSEMSVGYCYVSEAGDKGVSVGERSNVTFDSILVENSFVGCASKDFSRMTINWLTLKNCDYGLTAYQKKEEFGPAKIKIVRYVHEQVKTPFYNESGSTIIEAGISHKGDADFKLNKLYPPVTSKQ